MVGKVRARMTVGPAEKTKKEPTKVRRGARAAGMRSPLRRSRSSTPSTTIHHHSLREHTL
jgi:hypothetical protein